MMHHIGVGNWQDDASAAHTKRAIKPVLQVNHIRRAVHRDLGVHAVVGRQRDYTPHSIELAQVAVHHCVKRVGTVSARCVLVLHIVGRRQIHHVGTHAAHKLHARCEYKF